MPLHEHAWRMTECASNNFLLRFMTDVHAVADCHLDRVVTLLAGSKLPMSANSNERSNRAYVVMFGAG